MIFIVPLTLGTVLIRARVKGEIFSFWNGPRRLILSQMLVYIISSNGIGMIGTHGLDDENFTVDTRSIVSSDSDRESPSCEGQVSNRC